MGNSIKNLVIAKKIGSAYDDVKNALGNNKVKENLKASHGKRAENIAAKGEAVEKAGTRKKLGVDKSTYESILAKQDTGFSAKDAKHAERLYDRAVGSKLDGGAYLSSKSIHAAADKIVVTMQKRAAPEVAINAALHTELSTKVSAAIDGAKLGTSQANAAKSLALGLVKSMKYDEQSKEIHYSAPGKNFRQTADEQKGKRNTVQRYVDRKTNQLSGTMGLLGKKTAQATGQAQQKANVATQKSYNAATSVVAGTAVGVATVAGAAGAPVAAAAKGLWNVGKGVVAGAKEAGRSIKASSKKDAEAVRAEFRQAGKKTK